MATDVLDILDRDHDEIGTLFDDLRSEDCDHRAVMTDLIQRTAAHVAVERNVLYPAIKQRLDDGQDAADQLLDDVHNIERLLVLIERRKVNSPDMPDLVTELMDVMEAHGRTAHSLLFPTIRAALDAEERQKLGKDALADEAVVLSHPHPHMLSLGPLNRLLLPLAALVDRLRDRTVTNR